MALRSTSTRSRLRSPSSWQQGEKPHLCGLRACCVDCMTRDVASMLRRLHDLSRALLCWAPIPKPVAMMPACSRYVVVCHVNMSYWVKHMAHHPWLIATHFVACRYDTTANALAWALGLLAAHLEVQQKLAAELAAAGLLATQNQHMPRDFQVDDACADSSCMLLDLC